jgi:hypothetical protein
MRQIQKAIHNWFGKDNYFAQFNKLDSLSFISYGYMTHFHRSISRIRPYLASLQWVTRWIMYTTRMNHVSPRNAMYCTWNTSSWLSTPSILTVPVAAVAIAGGAAFRGCAWWRSPLSPHLLLRSLRVTPERAPRTPIRKVNPWTLRILAPRSICETDKNSLFALPTSSLKLVAIF